MFTPIYLTACVVQLPSNCIKPCNWMVLHQPSQLMGLTAVPSMDSFFQGEETPPNMIKPGVVNCYRANYRADIHLRHTSMWRHTHRYLAYGCLRVTGGRMPAALALNTAAHASSRGYPWCWSRCKPTGPEAVESCSTFLLAHSDVEQDRQWWQEFNKAVSRYRLTKTQTTFK